MPDITINTDDPLFILVVLGLLGAYRLLEMYVKHKLSLSVKTTSHPVTHGLKLDQLILKTVHELGADKGFIIYHNNAEQNYSVMHEYSPVMPLVGPDFQRVPYTEWTHWAIDKLRHDDHMLFHNRQMVDNEDQKNIMQQFGVNSYYCIALKNKGDMIGSLNLYFFKENGMNVNELIAISGRIAEMGRLLAHEIKSLNT